MSRRQYSGGAARTTIAGSIASSGGGNVIIATSTGWPDGSVGKFHVVVDPGLSSEEKILIDTRSGTTLTFSAGGRGADGSTATSHSSGATIWHAYTALDADEANAHVNGLLAAHAASAVSFAPGGTVSGTNVQTALTEVASEIDARVTAVEANNWVTQARMADASVGTAELIDGTVTIAKHASPDVLSLTATAAANSAGGTLTFTWDAEVSDPNGFITAPSDTVTIPAGFAGLIVVVLKTSGSGVTNYPIILFNDGSNSSYVGGIRADARNNTTQTLRLAVGNTIKCFSINTSGSPDTRSASLTLHRIAP